MPTDNRIFIPVFYASLETAESLSDEEFGMVVRELLRSRGRIEYESNLPKNLRLAYNFMLKDALSIFNLSYTRPKVYQKPRFTQKTAPAEMEKSFDVNDAFNKAIARSYNTGTEANGQDGS